MFTALAVAHCIQENTGLAIGNVVKQLRLLRTATIVINDVTETFPPHPRSPAPSEKSSLTSRIFAHVLAEDQAGRISGEHYISHSLIKLYTFDDPDVTVKHSHGFGIQHGVRPKNFVVNALCVNHNTALSVADAAALEFATFLRTIALRFLGGAGKWGKREEIPVSGDDLERWALKVLLNHAAGKAFTANQRQIVSPVPPAAVDFLLGHAPWPFGLGLGALRAIPPTPIWRPTIRFSRRSPSQPNGGAHARC